MKPLAIDLFCGLGGWTEGLLAEGYRVVGFDIERHSYPMVERSDHHEKLPGNNSERRWSDRPVARLADANKGREVTGWASYPAQLVLQDVLTIHGSQFKDAALIVASPPCQAYSYRAMPWKRAKALPPPDNSLFEACFRIQREAEEAAGWPIPMVVENVCGAQKWVGRARWHYGSFYLWGDVPALMPIVRRHIDIPKNGLNVKWRENGCNEENRMVPSRISHIKGANGGWFNDDKRAGRSEATGRLSQSGSKSSARKAASAHIAKIPTPLARWIARTYYPETERSA